MSEPQGEIQENSIISDVAYVRILENGYAAALFVPEEAPGFPSHKQIQLDIEKAGILNGIDDSVINTFIGQQIKGNSVVFAKGKQAVAGNDAKLFWHENSQTEPISLEVTKALKASDQDFELFQQVRKDQVILTKLPAQDGEIGINVFGDSIMMCGSDIPIPSGKNTRVSRDGYSLLAAADGVATLSDGKISVHDIHNIAGGIGNQSRNVKYDGSVYIDGDISPGVKVEALGDIYIRGSVEGADVYSRRGSIIIKQGVLGQGHTRILAGNRVVADFIQDATVGAKIDVKVNSHIVNSAISAGRYIRITSDQSFVKGGTLFAHKKIEVANAGGSTHLVTELKVGYTSPKDISRARFQQGENQRQNRLELVNVQKRVARLTLMKESLGELAEGRELQLASWELQEKFLRDKYREDGDRQAETEKQDQIPEGNRKEAETIRINKTVYPGVKVSIGDSFFTVDKTWNNVVFFRVGDKITIGP